MPNSFEIRKATPDDVPALTQLIQRMALESEGKTLNEAVLRNGIQAIFVQPYRGTYWVITAPDAVIGSTLITEEWSDWHNAPYWWIQSLYIRPNHRGQGLFGQLLNRLESEARQQGVPEIRLYVEQHNARAIRAYQKSGFEGEHYRCMTKRISV